MRLVLCWAVCACLCAGQASRPSKPAKNPLANDASTIDAGKLRFGESCAACHGANAEGGRGPNLVESDAVRHMSDERLFQTIHKGIPAAGMPAFALPDQTLWQLVSYLRSLSTPAFLVAVAGDMEAGREVYRRSQCSTCHMIYGQGGFLGPDLTDIAASRTVKQLRDAVVKPESNPLDGFNGVTVTLTSGETITGIAKDYSNYSIIVLDAAGKLHLLSADQVSKAQFAKKSLMPAKYSQILSAQELQNLLAFLSRQTVRPDAKLDQNVTNVEVR